MLSSLRKLTLLPVNVTLSRTYLTSKSLNPKKFTSLFENVPVRPRSGWQVFLRDHLKEKLKESKPDSVTVLTKQLAIDWNKMSEADKKVYTDKFAKEAAKHDQAFEQIIMEATPQQIYEENLLRKKYKLKTVRDPKEPLKPANSYLVFLNHYRKEHPERFIGNTTSSQSLEAGKAYASLSPEEKKKYEDIAHQNRIEYAQKMEVYNAQIKKFVVTKTPKSSTKTAKATKSTKAAKSSTTTTESAN
ncbi:hypothetical protein J3Q64DRAFT_1756625 [Phycomyces blakesleeanus]|uniref:HMG box domain-containing protein n=2 Tax=Phycomyces blakesleeanus TaxID=4837 RepID=A0A162ZH60_PHYB8|nr:hypothetical protein PHYBLDRAFT_189231 [Phycomyces blakesleeanus NRRL 1555(-)]OAD66681.1 hypothetical protein PHYBLDRAFT_189231 [Phycomyces blakesleeanus NRRL 1555(-)]|eukprot:XP_018284721.1 hypothetical protein PHYBLDRAFT_189231 [Phycomyces blakesleeanus NRRL 1555(-)]